MAQGVYTRNKRFTFVEKTAPEVGDGTEFPIPVTFDQIAEIYHRAKDSWVNSGSLVLDYGGGNILTHSAPSSDPSSTDNFYYDYTWVTELLRRKSYFVYSQITPIALDFRDGDYGVEYSYVDPSVGTIYARDIGSNELGIHHVPTSVTNVDLQVQNQGVDFYSGLPDGGDTTVLSASPLPTEFASSEIAGEYSNLNLSVGLTGTIAYTGADNPFSSDAQLYLGVVFTAQGKTDAIGNTGVVLTTNPTDPVTELDTGYQFIISLANGEQVSCALYSSAMTDPDTPTVTGSNWIHQIQTWWPYAAGSPAAPVWDTATGLPL